MAGSNQAANLSGMLSQIGGALSKAPDISGLTRNIENMGRPDVDPNDPESLGMLQQWQTKLGRTDEARLTQLQMQQVEAKRKEELAKQQAQQRAGAAAKYQQVVSDPTATPEQVLKARDEAMAVGQSLGVNMLDQLNAIDTNARQRVQMAWQEEDRGIAQAETVASKRIGAQLASAQTADDIQKVIDNTEDEFKGLATRMGGVVQNLRNQQAAAKERETDNVGEVVLERDYSGIQGEARVAFDNRLSYIQEMADKLRPNGTWLPGGKAKVMAELKKVDDAYLQTVINRENTDWAAERSEERQFKQDLRMAERPTKAQLDSIKAELSADADAKAKWYIPFDNDQPTENDIMAEAIRRNQMSVYTRYGRDMPGDIKERAERGTEKNPIRVGPSEDIMKYPSGTVVEYKGKDGKWKQGVVP